MIIETSINFNDRSVFTRLGYSMKEIETEKKGVLAGWNYHLSDNDLINLSPFVIKYMVNKYKDYSAQAGDEYTMFQLQNSSSMEWSEHQKEMVKIAEEYVFRNKGKIRNYKSKEKKKEGRRMKKN